MSRARRIADGRRIAGAVQPSMVDALGVDDEGLAAVAAEPVDREVLVTSVSAISTPSRRRRSPRRGLSGYRLGRGPLAIDGDVAAAGVSDAEDGRDVGAGARLSEVPLDEAADVLGHADAQVGGLALDERMLFRLKINLCMHHAIS